MRESRICWPIRWIPAKLSAHPNLTHMNSRSVSRETAIEDAIIAHPDRLGFPSAAAIRNVRVAWGFGRIDVMLLPPSGSIKLGLVEAKHHGAPDAICKVIGQLLMYYA